MDFLGRVVLATLATEARFARGLIGISGIGASAGCDELYRREIFESLGATHPGFRAYGSCPIGEGRDEAEIFAHMLLADPAHRNNAAGREADGMAEYGLGHEYALGVMTQSPVAEVSKDGLRGVEPVVDALVVLGVAAPFSDAGEGMVIRMCHDSPSQNVWLWVVESV